MSRIEDDFDLSWWTLNPRWLHSDFDAKTVQKVKDMQGVAISSETPWEARKMRLWSRSTGRDKECHFCRVEMCDNWNSMLGAYRSPSRCLWMPPDLYPSFDAFMNTLPSRRNIVKVKKPINPVVLQLIQGLNYGMWTGFDDDHNPTSIMTIQDFPNLDKLRVLAALSQ